MANRRKFVNSTSMGNLEVEQANIVHTYGFLQASTARLAQSVERKALNLVVVGLSPTVGAFFQSKLAALALGSDGNA